MAWREIRVGKGIDYEPDGTLFAPPRDSFEKKYNAVLAKYGKKGVQ